MWQRSAPCASTETALQRAAIDPITTRAAGLAAGFTSRVFPLNDSITPKISTGLAVSLDCATPPMAVSGDKPSQKDRKATRAPHKPLLPVRNRM